MLLLEGHRQSNDKPMPINGGADFADFTMRRQQRVLKSTFSAEPDGSLDRIEQMLLLQAIVHQIYCGTSQSPVDMVDLFENRRLYLRLDIAVDARAVYDAIAATDACKPQGV